MSRMEAASARSAVSARKKGLQSAMEYLMTYGWAILIIAVVLGSLYSLGVFNTANLQPKVAGGGCHVYRPNGPGSSWDINLVGSCTDGLPQYVAQLGGTYSNSGIITSSPVTTATSNVVLAGWVYTRVPVQHPGYLFGLLGTNAGYALWVSGGGCNEGDIVGLLLGGVSCHGLNSAYTLLTNQWTYLALVNSAGTWYLYVNGKLTVTGTSAAALSPLQYTVIGSATGYADSFNGLIANVQFYNTSLSANQILYLYNEGIGGVPIALQNLVGWWPLNGDTTDYSGNNNNGAPSAVNFNGTWTSAYYH